MPTYTMPAAQMVIQEVVTFFKNLFREEILIKLSQLIC